MNYKMMRCHSYRNILLDCELKGSTEGCGYEGGRGLGTGYNYGYERSVEFGYGTHDEVFELRYRLDMNMTCMITYPTRILNHIVEIIRLYK